jgi:competence protein ComEA
LGRRNAARKAAKQAKGTGPALAVAQFAISQQPSLIDVDRAPVAAVDSLPGIGPAIAARIVANRDSFGAFGSLDGLQRVRGIGPALAKAIRDRVTFSGMARPDAPTSKGKGKGRAKMP